MYALTDFTCILSVVVNFCLKERLELLMLVYKQIKANTPALMCSVPGYDASGWVDDLAAEMGKQLTSIAIGMTIDAMYLSMYNIYCLQLFILPLFLMYYL